jgi:hypothetical protein
MEGMHELVQYVSSRCKIDLLMPQLLERGLRRSSDSLLPCTRDTWLHPPDRNHTSFRCFLLHRLDRSSLKRGGDLLIPRCGIEFLGGGATSPPWPPGGGP